MAILFVFYAGSSELLIGKIKNVLNLFQSAHPYKYAGEKVDVQGVDVFKVNSSCKFPNILAGTRFCVLLLVISQTFELFILNFNA